MRALVTLLALPLLLACPGRAPLCDGGECGPDPAASPAVQILRFDATPPSVAAGEGTLLAWETANAAVCELAPGLGVVPRSDALLVRPEESTVYRLTCEGRSGPVQAEASVTVTDDDGGLPGDDGGLPDDDGGLPGDDGGLPGDDGGLPDGGPGVLLEGALLLEDGAFVGSPEGLVTPASALVFLERGGHALTDAAPCDAHFPARYVDELGPAPCVVEAGATVDSWLVHFQPAAQATANGTLTFAQPIVALLFEDATLTSTDASLGHPAGAYHSWAGRGMGPSDWVDLAPDRRTLHVNLINPANSIDQLRVLTSASPPLVRSATLVRAPDVASIEGGALEATHAFLFDEGVHTLAAPLAVDIREPGRWGGEGSADLPGGELAAGAVVHSFLWHFDAPGEPQQADAVTVIAAATFPRPVRALLVTTATVAASDEELGIAGLTYPAGTQTLRGLEIGTADSVWFGEDGHSVIALLTLWGSSVDQFRVLLAP